MLADGDLRADLARRGRARAELFTWQQAARLTVAALESLAPATRSS